jgi:hypothetical protein
MTILKFPKGEEGRLQRRLAELGRVLSTCLMFPPVFKSCRIRKYYHSDDGLRFEELLGQDPVMFRSKNYRSALVEAIEMAEKEHAENESRK